MPAPAQLLLRPTRFYDPARTASNITNKLHNDDNNKQQQNKPHVQQKASPKDTRIHKILSEFPLETAAEYKLLDEQSALISKVVGMHRYFEKLGHFDASTDPLKMEKVPPMISHIRQSNTNQCANSFESFGFVEADRKKKVKIALPNCGGILGDLASEDDASRTVGSTTEAIISRAKPNTTWEIGALYDRLKEIYCGNIGVEFLHILNRERINWLRNELETPVRYHYSADQKKEILNRVIRAVMFEKFARMKFATVKRFGLDGCECFVVGLEQMLNTGIARGLESLVLGMTHRGRLNALANIMQKPKDQIFSEFMGHTGFGNTKWGNIGDVKYHMGAEYRKRDPNLNKSILYTLLPNPSHLEAVGPVCLGTARARQSLLMMSDKAVGAGTAAARMGGSTEGAAAPPAAAAPSAAAWNKILPVIVHGDASIAGQGIVYEVCQMSALKNYEVGGTIHIIINNQIGFTTNPVDGSSGNYCTDVAKCIEAPVFHVNGDDPEAVSRVMEIAMKFRQKFHSDVFIDIVGYRREGHNELDMPKFTHPRMYGIIEKHPNVMDLYISQLLKEKVITQAECDEMKEKVMVEYNEGFEAAKNYKPQARLRPFNPQWQDQMLPCEYSRPRMTGVESEKLMEIAKRIVALPEPSSRFHPTVQRVFKARADAIKDSEARTKPLIDFGFAEALAFATLMNDGVHVRLMGQDCERGTFSHRHAKVFDQSADIPPGESYCPLQQCRDEMKLRGTFEIGNSLLSEFAALGYEYGFSLESPNILPIWEAQFGDFANGAQVMFDQFISSGETKWSHPSAITMMLPHGYDGQGSEHSSARLERFLQMCDDREDVIEANCWDINKRSVLQKHNIQVVNCSNAANFFHVLRRQIHRGFRKPLILMTPKRMLRMKEACSPFQDFIEETRFRRYYTDPAFQQPATNTLISSGITSSSGGAAAGGSAAAPVGGYKRSKVERLILCSGQIYHDLVKARNSAKLDREIMIARVEQISPFPYDKILEDIVSTPYLKSIVWCQEEPMNMGAWTYIKPRIETVLAHSGFYNGLKKPIYAGRDISAAPASGDANIHKLELENLLKDALDLTRSWNSCCERYL